MKKRILGVLLMLLLMINIGLTASAATKETYFEEKGVQYCWVRGTNTEKPTQKVQGYTWIEVYEGNTHVNQIGACEEHGIVNHDCGDIWERYDRLEFKWQLVVKELLVISCRDQAGYSMEGSAFMLLKEKIERDANGNPIIYTDENGEKYVKRIIDENGRESDTVISKAFVGADGYAKIRLEKEGEYDKRLDWEKDFQQLVLVQDLNPDLNIPIEESPMLQEYMSLGKRWYVNLVRNSDDEYEVYSITEAPPNKTNNYSELKAYHFDELTEGFVDEYDTKTQIMYLRNAFRVGQLNVNIHVEGFQGEIPSTVRTNVDITGPHDFSKRLRKTSALEDMRMGDYTIKCSEPVDVIGYTEKAPELEVTVTYPVSGKTKVLSENIKTVTLHRDQANAEINVTYTYYPNHVHTWDEGVVTEPTCIERGYTTYTCTGYDYDGNPCGETKTGNYVQPFGHGYEEIIVEATCTEAGYRRYTCVDCGDTYDEPGDPATKHIYEERVILPTCEKEGYTSYTCINCGFSYMDDYTDALEHDIRNKNPEIIAPTCTQSGRRVYVCLNCNEELVEELKDQPATGHSYDNGTETKPTCTEKGYHTYTCTVENCGYSYQGDYKDALGHKYTSQVVEPTKEREGYTLHTCSVCKDSYTDNHKDKLSSDDKKEDSNNNSSGSSGGSSGGGQSAGKNSAANMSGSASDALVVKFYDEDNQPLNSGMVALYNGKTQLKSWSCTYDNVAVVDNLEKYAQDEAVVAYTLKQSKAMGGYEVSKDTFTVMLQKQGGNLKVSVKKNSKWSKGSDVENGRDGKPIVTFRNTKETTQFAIACQVSVEFAGDCLPDEAMVREYMQKQHQFTLSWTDEDGEEKTESLKLFNGDSGSWKAKIPFGTQYTITATDLDGKVVTGLSENATGTLSAKQMGEKVRVEAEIEYKVQPASQKQLEMTVVDSENKMPLRGANFELKNPDGEKIATFISRENGKFYMEDVFPVLGDYLMVQSKAAEGYASLNGDIPVNVALAYEPQNENNVQLLNQYNDVTFAHQAVSVEEDGSFTIENDNFDIIIEGTSPKGGKKGLILGIGGGVLVLGAGGTAAVMMRKRKRRKNIVENAEDTEV